MRLVQPNRTKLDLSRRHRASCPHKDPQDMRCECPLQVSGWLRGKPLRYTALGTADMAEAAKQMALMQDPDTPSLKTITGAIDAYKEHILSLSEGTQRRYGSTLRLLAEYAAQQKLKYVTELSVGVLDGFRATRRIAPCTNANELKHLRIFLGFALDRKWIAESPAKQIKPPKNIKPPEKTPYTPHEMTRILAACAAFGVSGYERQRARAMVLLLRSTGLRISDATLFSEDRVQNGQIWLRTLKTGEAVFLPMPPQLQKELDALPAPRKADAHSRYYFWNGIGSQKSAIESMERTLTTVFKEAGLQGAHPHKFRHTLATDLLGRGYNTQEVANVLGISEAVVIKHYARWSRARQERINQAMHEVYADIFGPQPEAPQETVN